MNSKPKKLAAPAIHFKGGGYTRGKSNGFPDGFTPSASMLRRIEEGKIKKY